MIQFFIFLESTTFVSRLCHRHPQILSNQPISYVDKEEKKSSKWG